jgi:hypothetical protein
MKRFNNLVNHQLLKLLEALPQDGGPVLDQNPASPDEPARSTPQEKTNWEITLLDLAKTAIYNIKSDPDTLTPEDEERLTIDITPENKDQMLDMLYRLAGKEKAPTAPLPEPVEAPPQDAGAEPAPTDKAPSPGAAPKNKISQASRPG